ncbi:winged helix-turn-helix transcriptional regulator [Streptomyces niveus]|uniref:winged helix-turn-helix transcriptional regulator n=1 Tax=Streptomyces niveus TaxID=193462 RepID=UPI0036BD6EF1
MFDVPQHPLDPRRVVVHLVHRARARMTALGQVDVRHPAASARNSRPSSARVSRQVVMREDRLLEPAARHRLDGHRVLEVDHGTQHERRRARPGSAPGSYTRRMRWNEIGDVDCSVARALSVVGDRWTLLVLRDALLGVRRFEDFRANTGASRPLLTERLATLVEHGVLRRVRYQERPERYEYRLTEKGAGLYPVIVSLLTWGDRWMAGDDGPPVRLRHETCGHTTTPRLACPDCGEPIDPRDVRPVTRAESTS